MELKIKPLTNYCARGLVTTYIVYADGKPIYEGLTRQEAESYKKAVENGGEEEE